MDTQPTVSGLNLTRIFGTGMIKTLALREASLDLYRGQMALIMGPSGSGKSTLLAALSGLMRPDSGQVMVLGEDLWQLSERDRKRFRLLHCGFIFQGYNLFPALTARQGELISACPIIGSPLIPSSEQPYDSPRSRPIVFTEENHGHLAAADSEIPTPSQRPTDQPLQTALAQRHHHDGHLCRHR
jgi:energy-coupling factor transporter ATP-binding protein EcfA2